jgi:hypothetical protein
MNIDSSDIVYKGGFSAGAQDVRPLFEIVENIL